MSRPLFDSLVRSVLLSCLLLSGCGGVSVTADTGETETMLQWIDKGSLLPAGSVVTDRTLYAKKQNRPRIYQQGQRRGVVLLHGFLGSPFEVMTLVPVLTEAGFSVITPLIYGFGGDTDVANKGTLEDWRQTVIDAVSFLDKGCDEIHLIGFSLGGGLMVDFLLQGVPEKMKGKIRSAVLIAPYCKNYMIGGRFLNGLVSVFTKSISLKTLYRISHHPDLLVPFSHPDFFNSELPLHAVSRVLDLGDQLGSISRDVRTSVPTLALVSEKDGVVAATTTIDFLKDHFTDLQTVAYPSEENVRHQILIETTNPRLPETLATIRSFLLRQTKDSQE